MRQAIRPRLVILNVMLLAVGIAAWRAGYLAAFGLLGWQEIAMLAVLGAYTAVGLGTAWSGRWVLAAVTFRVNLARVACV